MKKKIRTLTELLNRYDKAYRIDNAPEVTDEEYDKLYRELVLLEKEYPQYKLPNSPTSRVGYASENSISNIVKMYSIDNVFTQKEILDWLKNKLRLTENTVIYSDIKADGLAIRLIYNDGYLMQATLRGDGISGDSIYHHMSFIDDIPKTSKILEPHEVYGEVILTESAYTDINNELREKGTPIYKTPRNAAAGLLNAKGDPNLSKLSFLAYGTTLKYDTYSEMMADLSTRYKIPERVVCKLRNIDQMIDLYNRYNTKEASHWANGIPSDGIVVKIDNINLQKSIGYTEKSVKFYKAWKYTDQPETASIEEIVYQVGRTGVITYVARISPVEIDGVTITAVNLYNEDNILTKKLFVGNIVSVIRRGGVIPYITGFVSTTDRTKMYVPLTHCPDCGKALVLIRNKSIGTSATKVCVNPTCTGILVSRFAYFCSRAGLNIQGAGTQVCKTLVKEKNFTKLSDVFNVTLETLSELFGEKNGLKIYTNIQSAISNMTLYKLINAIGISRLRTEDIKVLCDKVGNDKDALMSTVRSVDHMRNIGMSNSSIEGILVYMSSHSDEMMELLRFVK